MGGWRYHHIEQEILRLVLQYPGDSSLGYETSVPDLEIFLRPTFPDITPHEVVEALKRLYPKHLGLWKWAFGQKKFVEYVGELNDDEFFYRDRMRLRRTPWSDPYLQELSAKGAAMTDEARKARIERWEKLGIDRVKNDLTNNGGLLEIGAGTPEVRDWAWEWVRMKEQQEKNARQEASIAPGRKDELSRRVFIVHGHDEGAREAVARFLERLGLQPVILHEQANRGKTVIEKFEAHRDVGFAVVLLTPDDEGCEKGGTPRSRARQNVVLELGYFVGVLGRDRVCALRRGAVEIPSDFAGVVYVPFDETGGWKQALGQELAAAGFEIDWNRVMGTRS
jgi:predicted nucleotide-binding protein